MVKGTTQRVVVVRAKGGALFDEAIFLIRPGMEQECAVTDQMLLDRSGAPPRRSWGARRIGRRRSCSHWAARASRGSAGFSAFCCRGGRSTAKVLA